MIDEVLVPSAAIICGAAVRVDCNALAGPGMNVTISLSLIFAPLILPVIVAVPDVTEDVTVAE